MMINGSRRDFPLLRKVTHLASASKAPMPRSAVEVLVDGARALHETNDPRSVKLIRGARTRCRRAGARLMRCSPREVGLVFNTTHGINAIATGVGLRRGETIIIPDVEYPANVAPWVEVARRSGGVVKVVRTRAGILEPEDLAREVDEHTRVVALSHVEFGNGARNELESISEIVHRSGGILFVDAAQSLGILDTNVGRLGIDALSTCGYKWLCGPSGTGLIYANRDLMEELTPAYTGFESIDRAEFRRRFRGLDRSGWRADLEYTPSSSANRFEFGEMSDLLLAAFAESMEYLLTFGAKGIESRSSALVDELISRLDAHNAEVLTPREPPKRAGIVTFRMKGTIRARAQVAELAKEGILVSPRLGGIRASCHLFNEEGDLHLLLAHLSRITQRG